MADTTDTTATTATVTADATPTTTVQPGNAAPPVEAKTFTQEQLNAIVQQRLTDDRRVRPNGAPKAPEAAKPNGEPDVKQLMSRIEEMSLRESFNDYASDHGLTREQRGVLLELYKAQRPENPGEWFKSTKAALGLQAPTVNQPNNGTTTAPATPAAAAPSAPSGPVNPLTSNGMVDIWNLSEVQIKQLGPQGLRKEFEKALEVINQRSGAPPLPKVMQRK